MAEVLALGTIIKLGDGASPEVFSTLADVMDISAPALSVDLEEITNHSQTDNFKQHKPTLIDAGELGGTILWDLDEATHDDSTGILEFLFDREAHNFKIDFPSDPIQTWAFSGIVTSFEPQVPLDEHLKVDFNIKLSGAVTITNAATITGVDDTGSDGPAYTTGETVEVTVTFDKAVTVSGTPQLTLTLGSGDVTLSYASGTGSTDLVFSYVVQGGDSASAGEFVIAAQSIDLNSGSIVDANENAARLSFTASEVADVSDRTVN